MFNPDINHIFEYILKDDLACPEQERTIFYVKQLSVAQRNLIITDGDQLNNLNIVKIVNSNIIGWYNCLDAQNEKMIFEKEKINEVIAYEHLVEIYDYIISISTLNKEIIDAVSGLIRFQIYQNDKDAIFWSCEDCLKKGMNRDRNCKKFGLDKIELDSEDDVPEFELADKKKINKYSIIKKNTEEKEPQETTILSIGKRKYNECPISLISNESQYLISLVYWAKDSHSLFNEGGILNQANIMYELRNIIIGEEAETERELRKIREEADKRKHSARR